MAAVIGQTHASSEPNRSLYEVGSSCSAIVHLHKDFFEVEIVDGHVGVPRLPHFGDEPLIEICHADRGVAAGRLRTAATRARRNWPAGRGGP